MRAREASYHQPQNSNYTRARAKRFSLFFLLGAPTTTTTTLETWTRSRAAPFLFFIHKQLAPFVNFVGCASLRLWIPRDCRQFLTPSGVFPAELARKISPTATSFAPTLKSPLKNILRLIVRKRWNPNCAEVYVAFFYIDLCNFFFQISFWFCILNGIYLDCISARFSVFNTAITITLSIW